MNNTPNFPKDTPNGVRNRVRECLRFGFQLISEYNFKLVDNEWGYELEKVIGDTTIIAKCETHTLTWNRKNGKKVSNNHRPKVILSDGTTIRPTWQDLKTALT